MIKLTKHYQEVWDKVKTKEKYIHFIEFNCWRYQQIRIKTFGSFIVFEDQDGDVYK